MNYGKKGVQKRQKALTSKSGKVKKMFAITTLKCFLILFLGLGIMGLCLGIGMFKGMLAAAPDISKIKVIPTGYTTLVYDNEGKEIAKLVGAEANRRYKEMDKIPEDLAHAFVAIEDARFYDHNGIDIKGIFRAAYVGLKNNNFSEGASTITQQLLKNNVFTNWVSEKSFGEKVKRKVQEQYLALELEKTMNKDMILELYMNTINLGSGTLGVEAASRRYFNKSAYQLNLSECAVIAAITQNPSRFNPITHPEDNATRREKVLGNMLEQAFISQEEHDTAMADNVYDRIQIVNEEVESSSVNTYFIDALAEQVYQDLITVLNYNDTQAYTAVYESGLSIFSTQDSGIQGICDEVFANEENYPTNTKWYLNYELTIERPNGDKSNYSTEMYKEYFKLQKSNFNLIYASQEEAYAAIDEYKAFALSEGGGEVFAEKINLTPQPQASITVIDQATGQVSAMVGGRGAKEASRTLNRATTTARQPGSCFKVLAAFAPALDSAGMTLATTFNDAPFNDVNGRPVSNWWKDGYRGLLSIRYGIEQSANIIAAKTITKITPQLAYDYLINFGFTTIVDREEGADGKIYSDIGQATALGGITRGVTNMELNAAYAAIANRGTYIKPSLYTKILDHDGNVLIDNTKPESRQVIKETTAYLLTDAMVDVVTRGTGAGATLGSIAVAGKTGSTTGDKDAWFAAYTPYYTATVWAGYDNNVNMSSSNGETRLAKTLWRAVMAKIHADLPAKSFDIPPGIMTATVCSKSGKSPTAGACDATLRAEYFADGTIPSESCDVHYLGMVCVYSGLPAQDVCPFKAAGTLELIPSEDTTLLSGAATATANPLVPPTVTQTKCIHDAIFMATPGYEAVIETQRQEIQLRSLQNQQPPAVIPEPVIPETPVLP